MPYDDDDDLFSHEFDFVDDEDGSDVEDGSEVAEETPVEKPRRGRGKAADKPPEKSPPSRRSKAAPANRREPKRRDPAPPPPPVEDDFGAEEPSAPVAEGFSDEDVADEPLPEAAGGPPADHVVHIYEHGVLKRTIPRKFTDEEAVGFAEEYTRTGKPYGRYAVAIPEDEEPSPTFAGASQS